MQKHFRDESLPVEERIRSLLNEMTPEEKVSQLTNAASALPRLGIDPYDWWNEALHGVARAGTATVFPQAIGLAAMWNDTLLRQIGEAVSTEARAKYNEAQRQGNFDRYYGLTFWSPNVNIFRDPRWGRGHETYGEDPYLAARLGVAYIKGLQEGDGNHLKTAACAKHFAVHSGPEGTRQDFDVSVSKKDLYETYLPAFEACVKEGGVEAVMSAYNALDGVPCSCNSRLLQDILRDDWGFAGHVVSDCGAIYNIAVHHQYAEDITHAAALGIQNGCDLNCGNAYETLIDAYEEDLVTEADLDTALRRILRARFRLGMFDEKTAYDDIPYDIVACAEHKQLCLNAAQESLVLLKNDGILPLKKETIDTLAVIGPNANSETVLLGNYSGTPTQYSTVYRGFCEALGAERVVCEQGCGFFGDDDDAMLAKAAAAAERSDAVVLCLGLDASFEGEAGDANNPYGAGDRPDIEMTAPQLRLLQTVCAVNQNVIVLMLCGSAVAMDFADRNARAVIHGWYPGELGGRAVAELVLGGYSPSGRLPVTFYRSTADLPAFADYSMQNRTYRYFTGEPLYAFGHGLSYTSFAYGEVQAEQTDIAAGDVRLCVTVKNTGDFDGFEVVQLYISESGAADVPLRSLRRFKKIFLKKGAAETVCFTLDANDFAHINGSGEKERLPGAEFTVFIGGGQPSEAERGILLRNGG